MTSTLTSISPSRNVPQIDLMTLIYHLKYRNLRVQLYPIKLYKGELLEVPPSIPTSKIADSGIYQVFECLDGELEYEQDVPGKTIELNDQQILPDVAWEIRIKCHKDSKLSYGPWADRQRLILRNDCLFNRIFGFLEKHYGSIFSPQYSKIIRLHLNRQLDKREFLNLFVLNYGFFVRQ